jgi:hypothetical protein
VLGSAYFQGKFAYLSKVHRRDECYYQEVSFQTSDAKREAARTGKYYEWMIYCKAQTVGSNTEAHFYVSRAYKSYEMFVYRAVTPSYAIYLENLSTNVSIVDDAGTTELS